MLSKMAEKYHKETGEHPWGSISGHDAENDYEVHGYFEGPTNKYMNWLEALAFKAEEAANSTKPNNRSDEIDKLLEYIENEVDNLTSCEIILNEVVRQLRTIQTDKVFHFSKE